MGTGSVIRPGDVQRMSAGRGVLHSEFNPQSDQETHLLQIWIMPNRTGMAPSYEEKRFPAEKKRGRLCLIASERGTDGSVLIQQDARVFAGLFDGEEKASHAIADGRRVYLHVARGAIAVNGDALVAGDAAMIEGAGEVVLEKGSKAEVLLFDLP
jgi:redox-sensitive bicupin YhaK (pirin superfamily)